MISKFNDIRKNCLVFLFICEKKKQLEYFQANAK